MAEKSLHQIMNEIVGRLESHQSAAILSPSIQNLRRARSQDPLTEIEAFMKLDDLLAHLYKQYLDAKLQREMLVKAHGPKDPMVEIAYDMEDSAYCAYQTRYIEVRKIRELMAKAQKLMRERDEEIEKERRKEREEKFKNFILLAKAQKDLQEQNNRGGFEWAVLLLIFNLVPQPISYKQFYPKTTMAA